MLLEEKKVTDAQFSPAIERLGIPAYD